MSKLQTQQKNVCSINFVYVCRFNEQAKFYKNLANFHHYHDNADLDQFLTIYFNVVFFNLNCRAQNWN